MPQPPYVFIARGFEALFLWTGTLGCLVCLTPQLFLPVYLYSNVGPPSPPASALPTWSTNHCLAMHPLCPGCPSLPLLPVCTYVSSLTPWMSDFHTNQFSGSSGHFLLLNLLLCFFSCERSQSISTCASILAGSLRNTLFPSSFYLKERFKCILGQSSSSNEDI